MLSRAAEAIYWMNRYIERAENTARLLDVDLQLMLDSPTPPPDPWVTLLDTSGDYGRFQERFRTMSGENVVVFLTFDTENPNSIISCLRMARENARSIRDIISTEMWEQVNKFYLMVNAAASVCGVIAAPHDFLTGVRTASHLYLGITDATMSYGESWQFGRLGRLVERADKTSRLLSARHSCFPFTEGSHTSLGEIQWSAVLKAASGFEMYRQRFGRVTPLSVAAFLILDREFPRAMHACVRRAADSLGRVSSLRREDCQNAASVRLSRLGSELSSLQIQDIIHRLHAFLRSFQAILNQVDDDIFETFFRRRQEDRAPPTPPPAS